jgi:hypothetical protein
MHNDNWGKKKKTLLSFTIEEKMKNVKAISIQLLSSLAIRLLEPYVE